MLPQFPKFKKIEISDRKAVEAFTKVSPPYSDFNFTSLWAWDGDGERMISKLNNNLIVRFTDYSTHEQFLSFLGNTKPEHTACELIRYAKSQGLAETLRLIPEVSIKDIGSSLLNVQEEKQHFDYIYSIAELASMAGVALKTKRHMANKFEREHPDWRLEVTDLKDVSTQKNILSILHEWGEKKKLINENYELEHEEIAIRRLCETAASHALIVGAVFANNAMRAFTIEELLPDHYSLGHFWKADNQYAGTYDFLARKMAIHLASNGVTHWNWEQDLGVESLRRSKSSYRPISFLKKYSISAI